MVLTRSKVRRIDRDGFLAQMGAMQEAVESMLETFQIQFDMKLELDGMPARPVPEGVTIGSSIALTSETVNWNYAIACNDETGEKLTRILFDLDDSETPPVEDLADALDEIPNVAAGVFKAKRENSDEQYQLGLPIFIKGNSWIKYFPNGIDAIAQKLKGPDGIAVQVILIWQFSENTGGTQTMTTDASGNNGATATGAVPAQVLQEAVQAVVNTCDIQMDLRLDVDENPIDPRDANVDFGSSIALTTENGGWNLAVMANRPSVESLTRVLFAMEDEEMPEMEDMADAVGEIANVAAGVLKSSRAEAGEKVQLGLPLFLEGRGCIDFFTSGVQGMAQSMKGPGDLSVHVILIWQEGAKS